jgi:anthranilate synthase
MEEDRTRAASVFSALRAIVDHFHSRRHDLALYGAFGYDIAFQFDPIEQKLQRDPGQRDLALFFPTRSSSSTTMPPRRGSTATSSATAT